MKKEFEHMVFIGRFQPFHIGHFSVLKLALQKSENVIVIVGSSNRPRSAKNPLTFEERKGIIETLLAEEERKRVHIVPCNDYLYNDPKWETQIQTIVNSITSRSGWHDKPNIGVIGHSKDLSSYYLKKFPQWHLHEVPAHYVINATDVRHAIYEGGEVEPAWFVDHVHMDYVRKFLFNPLWLPNRGMDVVHKEYHFLKDYKKQWLTVANGGTVPYAVNFVTVDAVVVQSGHILLVKRGGMPGFGQWALPGGFLNENERIRPAVLRELVEETQIGVRYPKLEGNIKDWFIADHPDRSQRGRTISHCALIQLPDDELPKIKGSDDAADAKWIPLGDLKNMQNQMYEDHYDIIDHFLGL